MPKRIAGELSSGRSQIREILAEPLCRLLLGHVLSAGAQPAVVDQRLHHLELRRRDVVAEVDRELRGLTPTLGQPADVGVDDEEEAEDEQPGPDGEDREDRGAPSAPQARGGLP